MAICPYAPALPVHCDHYRTLPLSFRTYEAEICRNTSNLCRILFNQTVAVVANCIEIRLANYVASSINTPIQSMWNQFKSICSDCLNLVPSKILSSRFNQPWITPHTKRICRKKRRLFARAQSTGCQKDWLNYYQAKRIVPQCS